MRIILVLTALLLAPATQAAPTTIEKPAITTAATTGNAGGTHGFSSATSVLINNAMSLLGATYRSGGTSNHVGFDCSGFVRNIFQQSVGTVLPRSAHDQAAASHKVSRSELQPGDLVFFNTMRRAFSHVGIYIGNGKFIHAARTGKGVRVDSMSLPYWNTRFSGGGRVAMGSVIGSVESALVDNNLTSATNAASSTYGISSSSSSSASVTPFRAVSVSQRNRGNKQRVTRVVSSAKKQLHAKPKSSRSQKRGKR
ncbi:MAG: hypothetical protein RIR79_471 [Pseudomonadota bacterium]|jgi:hypothetical protein